MVEYIVAIDVTGVDSRLINISSFVFMYVVFEPFSAFSQCERQRCGAVVSALGS